MKFKKSTRFLLSLCLMTLCLFAFFAKRSGGRAALLTALITLTNFEVHRAGFACRVDMLLTAFMVTSLYALYRQWERHPGGTWRPAPSKPSDGCS